MNRKIEVDLSGERPLVKCDGEIAGGVTRAEICLEPDELPLLVVMLPVFEITGGTLPHGWDLLGGQHKPGDSQ